MMDAMPDRIEQHITSAHPGRLAVREQVKALSGRSAGTAFPLASRDWVWRRDFGGTRFGCERSPRLPVSQCSRWRSTGALTACAYDTGRINREQDHRIRRHGRVSYLTITPIAAMWRLLQKDTVKVRFQPEAETGWIMRVPQSRSPETITGQF
jgi:hypothetical protein